MKNPDGWHEGKIRGARSLLAHEQERESLGCCRAVLIALPFGLLVWGLVIWVTVRWAN